MSPTTQTTRVAILVDTQTTWSRSLVEGILAYTKEHEPWHMHLEPQPSRDSLLLPKGWEGDGIIARVSSPQVAAELKALNKPVVNISSIKIEGVNYPRVISSPKSLANLAYDTFRIRGFRNLAYVGDLSFGFVQADYGAYEKVVNDAGRKLYCFDLSKNHSLEDWLAALPKPIGVLCWGPSLGHQVIDSCNLMNLNVPGDVAVLGSNYDKLLSEASYPAQAGILMDSKQIGRTAAGILDDMMHGRPLEKSDWWLEPLGIMEKLSIDTFSVNDERMAKVMRYLTEHAFERITVTDVLKHNPMSRRTLERKFRQTFGCSIVDHIRQLRINHARELLATSDMPITEISDVCGFSSYNYLNRTFKQATGLSPSQYRIQSQLQEQ
ncbi:xylose operon transcription regulator XylR [Coraliomargarita akajimensis]|uniref:Transcriptional regulator, AraC family n=1 Tax=Coraliomargarita akajimensis (strain DSM 45221 / IAM 15411 / JCM 23193 / KCTC 12865 / 04OKA010-24) TaxID=583355 RepID=D5EQ82_CORAD|nr:DNA-binding transcriptional regulator [Coraliomargarita akajimensis]ADE53850.1 transcriptional regulator, AraC family [Coraliomargarita akajimensis DSM 45221]